MSDPAPSFTRTVRSAMTDWLNRLYWVFGKRCLDILAGLVGTTLLCLFFVPVAIAIYLDSSGPVLFSQERIGLWERPLRMYKFRTMKWPPDWDNQEKPASASDTRLTRVGRMLRKSSIDELPQFLHILRGEMSLIGPRPELASRLSLYSPEDRRRAAVKPGLTGWWQVHGRPQPMHEHAYLDMYYVDNRSVWLDVRILLRTVGVVLRADGAL